MNRFKDDFASFNDKVWLNAASEGPLPCLAAEALKEAMVWKSLPFFLDNQKFILIPKTLKEAIGRLIGLPARDIILANSASYGLHLLANGIHWETGDEILLMQNDFPVNILPWLALQQRGVKVIQISPKGRVLTPEQVLQSIGPKTRLFCISHVHTFTGHTLDINQYARICQDQNILFVLNISQSVGTGPFDFSKIPLDALVAAGYKWLCGPYGTGFCWIKPQLREQLIYNQAYWIPYFSSEELLSEGSLEYKELKTSRKYDIFGTANFFNFVPFTSAIEYWLKIGLENVKAHNDELIDQLLKGLSGLPYNLISPTDQLIRSALVVISHKNKEKNFQIFKTLQARGIFTAFWKGNIRISPHVYNSQEDIHRVLEFLGDFSG